MRIVAAIAPCLLSIGFPATAQELPKNQRLEKCFVDLPDSIAGNGGADCGYVLAGQDRQDAHPGEVR